MLRRIRTAVAIAVIAILTFGFIDFAGVIDNAADLSRTKRSGSVSVSDELPGKCVEMIVEFTDQLCNLHVYIS